MPVKVAVIGSVNMDLIFRVPRSPSDGETLRGHEFLTAPGGKGANQAVAAARLGAQVTFIGAVGSDPFGATLLARLRDEGVATDRARISSNAATGVALILVQDSGENSIVVALGANDTLAPEDLALHTDVLSDADVLLLQLEAPTETVDEAIRLGKAHGCLVVLDAAPPSQRYPSRLGEVDILTPNETEAMALLPGVRISDLDSAREAALALLGRGAAMVALKLGAQGCLLADSSGAVHVPALSVTAVDTTAAGDAWTAGFAIARAEGRPPEEAARFANACGALAATRLGAQPSLPRREEVCAALA